METSAGRGEKGKEGFVLPIMAVSTGNYDIALLKSGSKVRVRRGLVWQISGQP